MLAYIVRRLLTIIPMFLVLSFVIFLVIELPPGDYVSSQIDRLSQMGSAAAEVEIERIIQQYGLDQPFLSRYWRWITNALLHGEFGTSFQFARSVGDILADRIPLTVALSVSSLLLAWLVAIPIGIYSATHQYSAMDYIFTLFGFFGLGTPGWLIAILGAWLSLRYLNYVPIGLFSAEFIDQPISWAKAIDGLKHLWFPIVLTGLTTMGGTIRLVRNNLLDQLRQQYVITARAKGLSEFRLLIKYPVRLAINPLVSSVGFILPRLITSGGIVAIVLGIPTVSPILYSAITTQDMYLAGTILLFFTGLVLVGSLLSDILLAWIDPRIRFGGGAR